MPYRLSIGELNYYCDVNDAVLCMYSSFYIARQYRATVYAEQ